MGLNVDLTLKKKLFKLHKVVVLRFSLSKFANPLSLEVKLNSNMIKVALIEDNQQLREKLKSMMDKSDRLECVLAVDSVEKFQKYASPESQIDIVLSDIGLPGKTGIQGIPIYQKMYPEALVIILSIFEDHQHIFNAICAGANGYLLKDLSFEQLETHLSSIIEKGGSVLSPQVARRVLNYFQPQNVPSKNNSEFTKLSVKEEQIVQFLVDGLSYQQAADNLGISVDGVRYHIRNIYKKLQVKSKTGIIRKFWENKK